MNQYNNQYDEYRPTVRQFQRLIRQNANAAGACVALITAVSAVFSILMHLFTPSLIRMMPGHLAEAFGYAMYLLVYCVSFGVPCIVMVLILRIPLNIAFPMRAPRGDILVCAIFICLGARLIGSMFVGLVVFGIEIVSGGNATPEMPSMPMPSGTAAYIVYYLCLAAGPAIFEEALFRGVMLQSLRRFGDNFAVWATSVLFAFIHGNLMQGPYALLLGLVIGYFVVRSGSIWVGVIVHFINNLIALILEHIQRNASEDFFLFASVAFVIFSIIVGIIGIVYMRSRYGALFYLKRGDYPLTEFQKNFAFYSAGFVIAAAVIALFQALDNLV
ncbi:MAG: CPBP family intramembrane metalloprotease [Oscillospiraceae bacterium]|nr:CPBP family intramembrane metalloprotease [Oscillospiraceae bacterium]